MCDKPSILTEYPGDLPERRCVEVRNMETDRPQLKAETGDRIAGTVSLIFFLVVNLARINSLLKTKTHLHYHSRPDTQTMGAPLVPVVTLLSTVSARPC